ncbi:hypothetical protein [Streptomyces sp. NPDC001348]
MSVQSNERLDAALGGRPPIGRTAGSDYRIVFDQPPEPLADIPQQFTFEDFVQPRSRDTTSGWRWPSCSPPSLMRWPFDGPAGRRGSDRQVRAGAVGKGRAPQSDQEVRTMADTAQATAVPGCVLRFMDAVDTLEFGKGFAPLTDNTDKYFGVAHIHGVEAIKEFFVKMGVERSPMVLRPRMCQQARRGYPRNRPGRDGNPG